MQASQLSRWPRMGRTPEQAESTDSVRSTMNVTSRNTRRVLVAAALATVVAACGGGDEPVASPSPAPSSEVEGGELTGVQFDVRRDPG